jgi:hypothetical protein
MGSWRPCAPRVGTAEQMLCDTVIIDRCHSLRKMMKNQGQKTWTRRWGAEDPVFRGRQFT